MRRVLPRVVASSRVIRGPSRSLSSFLDTKERQEYDTVIGIGGGVGPMAGVAAHSKETHVMITSYDQLQLETGH